MTFERRILVTGGAGFIGSNLLLYLVPRYPKYLFVNVDCLTYAGNLSNLTAIEGAPNYLFQKVDIRDKETLSQLFEKQQIDSVIHLAAESHVDRSISGPSAFISTNIIGTFNLLELMRPFAEKSRPHRFMYISTDEVYGSLGESGSFDESSPHRPNSPYSASKAAADHLVRAYHQTYGLDTVTTHCSNNYGPYQFPEKLIPLMIHNALAGESLPVYGDGKHVRDWLFVGDHCEAIDLIFEQGRSGETYAIGGRNEIENIKLVRLLCRILGQLTDNKSYDKQITFVKDRPGHDRRYAIDATKLERELGWKPSHTFDNGLHKTVQWYLDNEKWLERCISGEYREYYRLMYAER